MASVKNKVIVLIQREIFKNSSTSPLSPMMNMSANKNVRFEFIENYFKSAGRFSTIFVHLAGAKFKSNVGDNTSSIYELRCIQRWFILKDFMHVKGYPKVSSIPFFFFFFVGTTVIHFFFLPFFDRFSILMMIMLSMPM